MGSLLDNLDRESQLLMYLADELPPEDRAEMDRRLASDAALTRELGALRKAHQFCQEALAMDAPAGQEASVRQISRAIRQWQVDRTRATVTTSESPRRRMPQWTYPAGIAAAAVAAVLIWSSNLPLDDHAPSRQSVALRETDELADDLLESFADEQLAMDFDAEQWTLFDADDVSLILLRPLDERSW